MVRVIRSAVPLALGLSLGALLGCSGGSGGPTSPAPAAPGPQAESPAPSSTTDLKAFDGTGGALLIADGTLDWATGEITLTPSQVAREGQLTPVANDRRVIDASPFLTDEPCSDCFRVTGLGLDPAGNVIAEFALKHPFSDRTLRQDLDVFDPIAIFYSAGTTVFDKLDPIDENGDGGADGRPQGNMRLIATPDGFTNRHDRLIADLFPNRNYTGNINPFVSFFTENDYSATGVGTEIAWHKFPMGNAIDRKRVVFLRPPGPLPTTFNFVVALSVSYGVSATFGNTREDPTALGSRLNPVYFNPEFNMKEAYRITADPGDGLTSGKADSSTNVSVTVEDWQAGFTVDPGYPNFPTYTNRTGLKARSDVATVKLHVPGVSQTLYSKTRAERSGGTGSNLDPYRFDFMVTNDLLAVSGTYTGLVAVTDEYQVDGQELLGYTATEVQRNFTTYQMVRVTVEDPACLDPDAVPEADRSEARSGEDITFTSANSTAPGSTLVEYAWDFDGVDPPEYVSATPDPVTYAFINETDRDIIGVASLKVTNACGTFNIDTVELTIHPNQPPVACAEADPDPAASDQTITLDASCSNDPDGDELTIEWDFNWDGNPGNFDVDATGITAQTSYCNTTNGTITANAAVRVTSNDASDIAPVDIAINGNRAPAAVIDATPNPVQSGVQVNFSSAGSADPDTDCGGDSISAYEWDFDYVAPQFDVEATGPSASTTYTNTGTVDITRTAALRVRDTRGGVSPVATEVVTIQPAPPCTRPTARGGVSTTTQVSGLPIEFFANLSTPNAGTFTRYSWDWDVFDAEPPQEFPAVAGNLPNQSHTYLWAGPGNKTFRARLTVYTSDTCSDATGPGADCTGDPDQCDINITVTPNTPPTAMCGATPNPVTAGCQVQFSEAGSTDPDPTGSIIRYQWDWDDRNGVNWANPDYDSTTQGGARHAYTNTSGQNETFKATLRVIDNNGTFGFCEVTLTVEPNDTPTAVASADPNPVQYSGTEVSLIDGASTDPDACGAVTYVWDFDASNGVILDPEDPSVDYVGTAVDGATVTYENPGPENITKTATLRVIDGGGLFDDATVDIVVGPPLPVPVVTWQEVKDAMRRNAFYTYQPLAQKSFNTIAGIVSAGGPWDFTDTSAFPARPGSKIFRTGIPADFPNVDIPNATVIAFAQTAVDADNYEGRDFADGATGLVNIWGLSSGAGDELQLFDPVDFNYPQTVGTFWNMFGEGVLGDYDVTLNIVVRHQRSGLTKCTKGTYNCVVEEATVTQEYSFEGTPLLSATQREFTWVSDEGYIIAQWTEDLDAGGQPTGNMFGKQLTDYTLP